MKGTTRACCQQRRVAVLVARLNLCAAGEQLLHHGKLAAHAGGEEGAAARLVPPLHQRRLAVQRRDGQVEVATRGRPNQHGVAALQRRENTCESGLERRRIVQCGRSLSRLVCDLLLRSGNTHAVARFQARATLQRREEAGQIALGSSREEHLVGRELRRLRRAAQGAEEAHSHLSSGPRDTDSNERDGICRGQGARGEGGRRAPGGSSINKSKSESAVEHVRRCANSRMKPARMAATAPIAMPEELSRNCFGERE